MEQVQYNSDAPVPVETSQPLSPAPPVPPATEQVMPSPAPTFPSSMPVKVDKTPTDKGQSSRKPKVKSNTSTPVRSNKSGKNGEGTTSGKRSHNRTYHTLLTNAKIRHLKKDDGEPLWRVDIQYDFLYAIFYNEQRVFTNSYTSTPGHTFADIYIDSMARSSKSSKILRDKLLGDRKAGLNMAMVCLLVNIGRMNTTLNFFPEMKAQLRTYHPIPSLQRQTDQNDYKQLQDAPRLKSILKGACEDRPEPSTLEELATNGRLPHSNPINLIFLLSTYATKVQELYFPEGCDFFDLIMNKNLSSASRGRAFLWLMWSYLETQDYTNVEELRQNPFGLGRDEGHKIPEFEELTPELVALENLDPEPELEFGHAMTKERSKYIEQTNVAHLNAVAEALAGTGSSSSSNGASGGGASGSVHAGNGNMVAKGKKPTEATPGSGRLLRIRDHPLNYSTEGNEFDFEEDANSSGKGKGKRSVKKSSKGPKLMSPTPGERGGKVKLIVKASKRAKMGISEIRQLRCQREISRMLIGKDRRRRRVRYSEGPIKREWERIKELDPLYDSDEDLTNADDAQKAKRRLADGTYATGSENEPGDYGEEVAAIARACRRALRWIERWNSQDDKTEESAMVPIDHDMEVDHAEEEELVKHRTNSVMRLDNLLDS